MERWSREGTCHSRINGPRGWVVGGGERRAARSPKGRDTGGRDGARSLQAALWDGQGKGRTEARCAGAPITPDLVPSTAVLPGPDRRWLTRRPSPRGHTSALRI